MKTFADLALEEKSKATEHPCGLFILRGENRNGNPTVKIWKPKTKNPHAFYRFKNAISRERYIEEQIKRMEAWNEHKEERKAARKNKKQRTQIIKKALKEHYKTDVRVTKGTGTAASWIHVTIKATEDMMLNTRDLKLEVEKIAEEALKAEGESLSFFYSDDSYNTQHSCLSVELA